jgi:cytochrome d ubiquinol oxidase subunit II
MDLHILWFVLISILFTGFFVLEGFDFGVGMLVPFLGRQDNERRMLLNAIGPFWDANEVWLITAAGAMFAAFPNWYATLFSALYPALFGVLFGLILRGAAFEFRSLVEKTWWRRTGDWMICLGSLLPGFFWGVIVANMLTGLPIDAQMNFVGTSWQLFNPYALLCGLLFVLVFALHGASFLGLRLTGEMVTRAQHTARWLWLPTVSAILGFVLWSFFQVDLFRQMLLNPFIAPFDDIALVALLATGWLVARRRSGWAFGMTTIFIICVGAGLFMGIFPHVMISTLNPAWSLTVYNTSASPYSLTILSWLSLTLLPMVLLYQGWNYWVFRKRLTPHAIGHY